MVSFKKYFLNEWIYNAHWKWQIFHTPPGFASVNLDEAFNKQIKKHFTQYEKLTCKNL